MARLAEWWQTVISRVGLPPLHMWTEAFRVYAINIYKNDLPFKQTLARDDLHGLLIAYTNENSAVVFSDSNVFDKVSDNN